MFEALAGVQGRVLDAGCGYGGSSSPLWARAAQTSRWWGSNGRSLRDSGLRRNRARRSAGQRQCHAHSPHAASTPRVAADVLCHETVDPEAALAELRRVLQPGRPPRRQYACVFLAHVDTRPAGP